jgi:hypothetical protein
MNKINFIHIPKNAGNSIKQICNQSTFKYNPHSTNVYNNIANQLIIIRNPIDRFISAVYYSLQKWSSEPHVKYLIDHKIDTPEKWVQIWMNPLHKHHMHLMNMIKNNDHKIGNKLLEYKWTYSSQSLWINNPKYVIIMDNFNEEFQYFKNKYNIIGDIKNINSSNHINDTLSNKSIDFLRHFYKKDFILYNLYKNKTIKERL